MLASIPSATVLGVRGSPVTVEVFVGDGLPGYHMVGMPDTACRESRDRVRAAMISAGFGWPNRCITVNLAPTSNARPAPGSTWRSPSGCSSPPSSCPATSVRRHAFIGELGLDGTIRRVPGVAPMVDALDDVCRGRPAGQRRRGADRRPRAGAGGSRPRQRGRLSVRDANRGTRSIRSTVPAPTCRRCPTSATSAASRSPAGRWRSPPPAATTSCSSDRPGSGKTMLAQRLAGLLPPLDRDQALETTMVHSAAGLRLPPGGLVRQPPFRAPHHTTSVVGLVGGGSHQLRPGEVSLANNGVLFMDELGEFGRAALEGLREPLEEGVIRVARAAIRATMPARFLLVAATNPCPCGGGPPGACECDDGARASLPAPVVGADHRPLRPAGRRPPPRRRRAARHRRRASRRPTYASGSSRHEQSPSSRAGKLNAALAPDELDTFAPLSDAARALLREEVETRPPHRSWLSPGQESGADDRRPRRSCTTSRSRSPTSSWRCRCGRSLRQRSVGPTADRWIA